MKKVFCKNCEYNSYLICKYFKNTYNEFTGNKKEPEFFNMYKENNGDGECRFYKKKWYKFFI